MREVHIYTLSARVNEDGGPVSSSVQDDPGEGRNSLKQSGCRNILILVHGFNNTRKDAEKKYELFYRRLKEHFQLNALAPDAIAFFHWPGNHYRFFTWDALAFYHLDILRARESAKRLADYLAGFHDPGTLRVTLIGHSLGCRLILETLKSLGRSTPSPKIELISLMAPAVPVELVKRADAPAPAGALNDVVGNRKILHFYSWRDIALSGGFPVGQLNAYLTRGPDGTRIEEEAYADAMGLHGRPDYVGTSDTRFATTNSHGAYWGDVLTTDALRVALDPRQRALPPPGRIAERELVPAPPIEKRHLTDRR